MRSKDELLVEAKYTKSWKGSGNQNTYFMEPPIMKPKILDPWTAARVQQPERAYTKFFASNVSFQLSYHTHTFHSLLLILISPVFLGGQKPFAFTDKRVSEFGPSNEKEGISQRYAEILAE